MDNVDASTSQFDFSNLGVEELFMLARKANVEVYARALPIAQRVARAYCRNYTWIDPEDLTQDLMSEIPRVMYGYQEDNAFSNTWSKYLYFKLQFKAKDILRREDPLGISYPQKKQYPQWHRLGDESLEGFEPTDMRELLTEELEEEIQLWKEFFRDHPDPRKIKRGRIWDKVNGRVKFRKQKMTLLAWYKIRKRPKQLSLGLG